MGRIVRLLRTAWKSDRRLFIIRICQNLFEALIPMTDLVGIGVIIRALTEGQSGDRVFSVILYYVLAHFGVSLAGDLLNWQKDVEERKATDRVQFRYARESLEVDYPCIQTGSFLDLKRKSMNVMPAFYIKVFGETVSCIVKFAGIVSVSVVIHPILLLCIVLLSFPAVRMSFRRKKAGYQYLQEIAPLERISGYLYKVMTEYAYAKDIRIYGGEELIAGKYKENGEEQLRMQKRLGRKNMTGRIISDLCGVLQLVCMLAVFSWMVYQKRISVAEYTVMLSASALFASTLTGFFENAAEIKEMCRYTEIIDQYQSFLAQNGKVYHSKSLSRENGKDPSGYGVSVDFDHVSFRYPGREEEVLKDVSFHISAGEKVSFVGRNGAGKTTIINLLLRLYEPSAGTVRINGTDIGKLPAEEYYRNIGVVLQDFFLYAYPVRENLCFGRERPERELWEALEQAGLKERIAGLPKGLSTSLYRNLDPEGVELSGGEGQKLAMARAILKRAGVLILDEPTSSLDPLAEYGLFSAMSRILGKQTGILISHRLSSTKYSDRILVFAGGRLIQSGSHRELMQTEGLYRDLYRKQAKYYTGEDGLYGE